MKKSWNRWLTITLAIGIWLIGVAEVVAPAEAASCPGPGVCYYVSASAGDDANHDGLSEGQAFQTIQRA